MTSHLLLGEKFKSCQLLQPLADGHGKWPHEHIIYHLEKHILSIILIVCLNTSFLAVLINSSGN